MPSRRSILAGLIATALPGRAVLAQSDGFRVIRARADGFDGAVPGPVLHVRRGEELKVRLVNETAGPTAIHWHGVRVPNAMDGSPLTQKPVAPGGSFDYRFAPPDAGTFWYRASPRTAQSRALHGLLVVQETASPKVDEDIVMLLDSADDTITVNGVAVPDLPLWPNLRYRLRLANASERFITLRFQDHPVHVIAIDGQPAEPFRARENRITLSPGNRADLLLDAVLKANTVASIYTPRGDSEVKLASLTYGSGIVSAGTTMPDGYAGQNVQPLPASSLPERMDFRGALRVELAPDSGPRDVPAKPLFAAKRGRTVMLALPNKSDTPVVIHIHGHCVRLLDALDDGWKPFWLDTILCAPRQTTRVAFVADNPGKWLLEARAIGSDAPSLSWFEVS
jgi:FtsP/CotA-like multicopper oxidase with cupredoxin domain